MQTEDEQTADVVVRGVNLPGLAPERNRIVGKAYGHVDLRDLESQKVPIKDYDLLKCALDLGRRPEQFGLLTSRAKKFCERAWHPKTFPGAGLLGSINSHSIPVSWAHELIGVHAFREEWFWHEPWKPIGPETRILFQDQVRTFDFYEVQPIVQAWLTILDFVAARFPEWFMPSLIAPEHARGIFIDDADRVHSAGRIEILLRNIGVDGFPDAVARRVKIQTAFEFCVAAMVWYLRMQHGPQLLIVLNVHGASPLHRILFNREDAPADEMEGWFGEQRLAYDPRIRSFLRKWVNGISIEEPDLADGYDVGLYRDVHRKALRHGMGSWNVSWWKDSGLDFVMSGDHERL